MTVLEQFKKTVDLAEDRLVDHVAAYIDWMVGRQESAFEFSDDDDLDLRAYLLHLRVSGIPGRTVPQIVDALRRFYNWAEGEKLISDNPFAGDEFDQPLLTREAIQRRKDRLPKDSQQREITQLRALNELGQHLNRSVDVQSALDEALATLVRVMDLQTAWAFLLPEITRRTGGMTSQAPHDFALVTACGLPPGLEQNDRYFLCQPPDCHCQYLAREGRLKRAVNVVECSRMQDSAKAEGDNRGLYFHASAPLIASGTLLGIINVATAEWQLFTAADLQFLSIVSSHVTAALERAALFDLARSQRERFEEELEMARQVQASLLPEELPEIPGYEAVAHWHAAREVAGDFYDVFPLSEGRFGFVIADVSDKGAPAALYMAMALSLIRSNAGRYEGPARTLVEVNEDIMAHSASDMFVTVFLGVLDPAGGSFTYASAGHDPPFLRRAGGQLERLTPTGALIGIYETFTLREAKVTLAPGDMLLLYTDGLSDALNEAGEEYGNRRLAACIRSAPATAEAMLEQLHDQITTFVGAAPQLDDITMIVLARQV